MGRLSSPRGLSIGRFASRSVIALFLGLTLILAGVLPASAASGYWSQKGLAGKTVTSIAVDPTNSSILLAGTSGYGIYRSNDRGATWVRVNTGLTNLYVNDVEFDPRNPYIVYAVAGRCCGIADTNGGIFRSVDRGRTWTRKVAGSAASVAVSQSYPNVVYAVGSLNFATGLRQVAKSVDRGQTWKALSGNFQNSDLTAVAVDPTLSSIVVVGGTTEGGTGYLFRSISGGAAWMQTYTSASATGPTAISDLAFNSNGTAVYAAASTYVLRSTNDGWSWRVVSTAGSGSYFVSVLAGRTNPAELFVGTSGSVWRSLNYGSAYTKVDGSIWKSVNALAVDRSSPRTLYGATASGVWAYTFP